VPKADGANTAQRSGEKGFVWLSLPPLAGKVPKADGANTAQLSDEKGFVWLSLPPLAGEGAEGGWGQHRATQRPPHTCP